ncbi:MAG TPA: MBL fold metallo-hydrolase [Actinomycetota bacterium]|nr:MBL fold metallo-hydrolase [Actinomycetota bacterium]
MTARERPFVAAPYPGIIRVTHDIPFPGLKHVHTYLADGPGGGLVLVDTALGGGESLDRIEQTIAWLGRDITDLERIVLTHCHPDHIGLASVLQERSGAPVVCHPNVRTGFELMQTPDRWQAVTDHYAEHGRETEDVSARFFLFPMPETFEFVEPGDVLRLADGEWEVHYTPGHEVGHIALHRAADGVLLSGDTLLRSITPHVGYTIDPPDPLGQFLDSLALLASLDPKVVLAGHGRVFAEGAERAQAIRWHHRQRLKRIEEVLARHGPMTALDTARRLFDRELRDFIERLALAETLSHLEYLRLRERAVRERVDGLWVYSLPSR